MAGRKPKLTKEQVAEALRKNSGAVYLTARALGVGPKTIYNYLERYPEVKEVKEAAEGTLTDTAELKLYDAVLRGEWEAVKFVLRTKGKGRGYVERMETSTLDIDVTKLSDEQIDRLLKGEDPYAVLGRQAKA